MTIPITFFDIIIFIWQIIYIINRFFEGGTSMIKSNIPKEFYLKDALTVATAILGKILVRKCENEYLAGRIVETEAYIASIDKASHAFGGKRTPRVAPLYEEGGIAYVYFIYGMYSCMNVITGPKNDAQGVLIRALEPLDGMELMSTLRFNKSYKDLKPKEILNLTSGPGKLCKAMDINKALTGKSLYSDELFIYDDGFSDFNIVSRKRIGIDYAEEAKDFLWRFYIEDNKFISKK